MSCLCHIYCDAQKRKMKIALHMCVISKLKKEDVKLVLYDLNGPT